MAYKIITDSILSDIANAIRNKKGTANTIAVPNMADEILTIPEGTQQELVIHNATLANAITRTGTIAANSFIQLKEIINLNEVYHNSNNLDIWYIEFINNTKLLIIERELLTSNTYNFKYKLLEITLDNTLSILDSGTLVNPTGSNYYQPSRIFKANNNTYFYQFTSYLQPFIISNDKLVFGTAKQYTEMYISETNKTTDHYYDHNKLSYGRYGSDWVIMAAPKKGSKERFINVKVSNNTIIGITIDSKEVGNIGRKNTNIYTLNESNGEYFYCWKEKAVSTGDYAFSPLSAVINSEGNLQVTSRNSEGKDAGYYLAVYSEILPSNTSGVYYAMETTGHYLLLNNQNAGYESKYSSAPLKTTLIKNIPNTTSLPSSTNNSLQTLSLFTYLGNDYYGWIVRQTSSTTKNYYLAVVKKINNEFYFLDLVPLFEDIDIDYANIGFINNKLFVLGKQTDIHMYNIDLNHCVVELLDNSNNIYGVTKTPITNTGGKIWINP